MKRDNLKVYKAKIMECKTSHLKDQELIDDSYKYDYYIHYSGKNRRLDEWVQRKLIEITNVLVTDDNDMK